MKPVRVKVYGLVPLTRRAYLTIQCVGLAVVVIAFTAGVGLARPRPPRVGELPPVAAALVVLLDLLPWLAGLFLLAGLLETWVVLKAFARKEAEQRAAAELGPGPSGAPPLPPAPGE